MAFCGFSARVLLGVTYLTAMALGKPSPIASTLGASEDYGSRFWNSCSNKRMLRVSLTESRILLMAA